MTNKIEKDLSQLLRSKSQIIIFDYLNQCNFKVYKFDQKKLLLTCMNQKYQNKAVAKFGQKIKKTTKSRNKSLASKSSVSIKSRQSKSVHKKDGKLTQYYQAVQKQKKQPKNSYIDQKQSKPQIKQLNKNSRTQSSLTSNSSSVKSQTHSNQNQKQRRLSFYKQRDKNVLSKIKQKQYRSSILQVKKQQNLKINQKNRGAKLNFEQIRKMEVQNSSDSQMRHQNSKNPKINNGSESNNTNNKRFKQSKNNPKNNSKANLVKICDNTNNSSSEGNMKSKSNLKSKNKQQANIPPMRQDMRLRVPSKTGNLVNTIKNYQGKNKQGLKGPRIEIQKTSIQSKTQNRSKILVKIQDSKNLAKNQKLSPKSKIITQKLPLKCQKRRPSSNSLASNSNSMNSVSQATSLKSNESSRQKKRIAKKSSKKENNKLISYLNKNNNSNTINSSSSISVNPQKQATTSKNSLKNSKSNTNKGSKPKLQPNPHVSSKNHRQQKPSSNPSSQRSKRQIPLYSSQAIQQIQLQLSRLNSFEYSQIHSFQDKYSDSILSLLSWVWQAQIEKGIRQTKQTKMEVQSKQQIDVTKCIRKLIQFYAKTDGKIFSTKNVRIYDEIIRRNGIRGLKKMSITDLNPLKNDAKMQPYQQPLNHNYFIIHKLSNNINQKFTSSSKNQHQQQQQIPLVFLLVQAIIYHYHSILLLDIGVALTVMSYFRVLVIDKKLQLKKQIQLKLIQGLIYQTFAQLSQIRQTKNNRSPFYINKRQCQPILWQFFIQTTRIMSFVMKKQLRFDFNNNGKTNLQDIIVLETANVIALELTRHMKRFPNKITQINIIDVEIFLQSYIQKVIQFNIYQEQLKAKLQSQKSEQLQIEVIDVLKIKKYQFQLPLFDWAILMLRNAQYKTFENILRKCKRMFFRSLEKPSCKQFLSYKQINNDKYARFTIQQDPDDDLQQQQAQYTGYESSPMQEKQQIKQSYHRHSLNYHSSLKTYCSITHLRFLSFQEITSQSKSIQNKFPKSTVNSPSYKPLRNSQFFLLVLLHKQYIFRLLEEIEFIQSKMLSPKLGSGLIKLSRMCHEFKSLQISQKYIKQLQHNMHYKFLLKKVFQRDTSHQQRLSQNLGVKVRNSERPILKQQQQQKQNGWRDSYKNQQMQIEHQFQPQIERTLPNQILKNGNDDNTEANMVEKRFQMMCKSCQLIFFQLIKQIQQKVPLLNLQTYLSQLVKTPQIFRVDIFYQNLLQTQHLSYAREYLTHLITAWIDNQLRFFSLLQYYQLFVKHCLKYQKQKEIQTLIKSLSIGKLSKLHFLLLKQTFDEQTNYKFQLPQELAKEERLNVLSSGGFQQKTRLIDRFFPEITQILLWRRCLKDVVTMEEFGKYVHIKSYFMVINHMYSVQRNSRLMMDNLSYMIARFKTELQKEKVDQVSSIFHFLSLALFTNQNQDLAGKCLNLKPSSFQVEQLIEQVLFTLRQNVAQIMEMYKRKQSMTLRVLSQDIRKKGQGSGDKIMSQMQQRKRAQVGRALNKSRNMHEYLIKNIIRFVQNIQYSPKMLLNLQRPQELILAMAELCKCEHLTKQQKSRQVVKLYYATKMNFKLSSVSSNNLFETHLRNQLKRYHQTPDNLCTQFNFILMLRTIAQQWTEQLASHTPNGLNSQATISSKQTKGSKRVHTTIHHNSPTSKISSKRSGSSKNSLPLVSVQKILDICLTILKHPLEASIGVRQCQLLKQKMVSLQIVESLSRFIISKADILKSTYPVLMMDYKRRLHGQFSSILIRFLMNDHWVLGRHQPSLVLMLRLKSLCIFIQNYRNSLYQGYDQFQWRLAADRQTFWFIIFSLTFDKNIQIRFMIINYTLSRFKEDRCKGFSRQKVYILSMLQIMALLQPVSMLQQIVRRTLEQLLNADEKTEGSTLSLHMCVILTNFSFIGNFNTMHQVQKGRKKINQRHFYAKFIDMIFQKKQVQSYIFPIAKCLQSFTWTQQKFLSEMFLLVKFNHDFNIELLPMPGQGNKPAARKQSKKEYFQLLTQLKQVDKMTQPKKGGHERTSPIGTKINTYSQNDHLLYDKKYPHAEKVFNQALTSTLNALIDSFKWRTSKANKKYVKNKKPITIVLEQTNVASSIFRLKSI